MLFLPGLGGSVGTVTWNSPMGPFFENGSYVPPGAAGGHGGLAVGDTLRADLNTDGWQTIQAPNTPQAFSFPHTYNNAGQAYGGPIWGPQGDILNDAGKGSRFKTTMLNHFDHIFNWCNANYGTLPTLCVSMSWGSLWLVLVAATHGGTGLHSIQGAYIHCPVNDFANAAALGVGPPTDPTIGTSAWTGISPTVHALDGVVIPVRVTWAWFDGYVTYTPPPIDAISMAANGCNATGGSATVRQSNVGTTTADLNSDSAFLGGTGVLNLGTGSPVSAYPTSGKLYLGNIASTFFSTPVILAETVTYTGVDTVHNNFTGCTSTPDFLGRSMVLNPAVTVTGPPTFAGGLVSGLGIEETHIWSTTDSADCLAWFQSMHANYPAIY